MLIMPVRLKELRRSRKLIQKDVALAIGIHVRTYRRHESGKTEPPATIIVKLADFFDVSTDYLLGRTDNPNIYK